MRALPLPEGILPAHPPTEDGLQLPSALLTVEGQHLWRYGIIDRPASAPRSKGYFFWDGVKLFLVKKSRYGGWFGIDRSERLHRRMDFPMQNKMRDAIVLASKEI